MVTPTAPSPPTEGRVSTGNRDLDAMLEGGLVARRPYLVVGPSGTGKTTLALQFLCEGIRNHERSLLVTIEEPPNEARLNHPGLAPELERVDVFDAIPDIMRYERVPFKDIASVRYAQPFASVQLSIRQSPELSSVEVTLAALEQMLRTEVLRKGYSRIAIDSLTALQYFCMKGFDPVAGAQTFLRFLSDLKVTTIITVESPLEDVETPERALARGEIRLFRWEHENRTVRAIGVEKFRGSPHDVRLHPYRIGPQGLDINLELTISRDTRQIIEPTPPSFAVTTPTPIPLEEVISPVDPLAEEVRDLVLIGADLGPVRTELEAALGALAAGDLERSREHMDRATSQVIALSGAIPASAPREVQRPAEVEEAVQRIVQRGESARAGFPPTRLPPPRVLEVELEWVLSLIPPAAVPSEAEPSEAITSAPEEIPTEAVPEEVVGELVPTAEPGPTLPDVEESPIAVTAEVPIPPETAPERPEESSRLPTPSPPMEPAEVATSTEPVTVVEPPRAPTPPPQYPAPPEPPSPSPVAPSLAPVHVHPPVEHARAREPPAPPRSEEPRPPLPSFEAGTEKLAAPSGSAPGRAGTGAHVPARPARASRAPSIPSGPRLPHTGATPPVERAAEVPPSAIPTAPVKRRKKSAPTVRKKLSASPGRPEPARAPHEAPAPPPLPGSSPLHPPEVSSTPRAKKRSTRKRKAPATSGISTGPVSATAPSSDPPSPDPPAPLDEPEEGP